MGTFKGLAIRSFVILQLCFYFYPQAGLCLDVAGVIDTDTQWTAALSPVRITGDVRISQNVTLTIEPGVIVKFQPRLDTARGYRLRVDGVLVAMGNQGNPVVFTSEDAAYPWGSIIFNDISMDWDSETSSGCALAYCLVENGGNDPDIGGMISTINAMPMIMNNLIRFSSSAGIAGYYSTDAANIVSLSGELNVFSNRFHNNATGVLFSGEGGTIENNYFLDNGVGISLASRSNDIQITDNSIINTMSADGSRTGLQIVLAEPSNGIKAYHWEQTAGTPVALLNANSPVAAFVAPSQGNSMETLTFALTVTDKNGRQATQEVEITVIGNNPPPVAEAGARLNVQLAQEEGQEVTVTLNGAGSRDAYLGITGYQWRQLEGQTVQINNSNSITADFTVPGTARAGDRMSFQLQVVDQAGLTSTDTIEVIYFNDNVYPVAEAGEDQVVSRGQEVFLDGSGSADPDGGITSYTWIQTEGPSVVLNNSNTGRPHFVAPSDNNTPVTLSFQITVTDNGGLTAADTVSITVKGPLTAVPGEARTVSAGNVIFLDGSESINAEASATVDILDNIIVSEAESGSLVTLSSAADASFLFNMYENNFNNSQQDSYLVYAADWAADISTIELPGNWWGTDDATLIDSMMYDQSNDYNLPAIEYQPFSSQPFTGIGSQLSYPPYAEAGPDQEVIADSLVTLDGSDSYDPGGLGVYHWEQTEGPSVTLRDANSAVANFIAPLGGSEGSTLRFQLTVATDDTFYHSDTTGVDITPDGEPSTIDLGSCFIAEANKRINGGALLFLILAAVLSVLPGIWRSKLRDLLPIFVFMLISVFCITAAHAGYFAAGGGAGGDADEFNVTIETGAKDISAGDFDLLFGVGIPLIPHADNEFTENTISYACPNSECIRMGSVRKGTEVGFYGKFGIELWDSDFYINALGGFTAFTESELARSPVTGRVYEQSTDSKLEPMYGGGISYFIDYKLPIVIHVDYDNMRGVTGTIGWHW